MYGSLSDLRPFMAFSALQPAVCSGVYKVAMPIYEYELCEGNCAVCGGKFTLRRPLDAKELTNCPACKKPVRKVFSTFSSPRKTTISAAKKAGFTVLKKI